MGAGQCIKYSTSSTRTSWSPSRSGGWQRTYALTPTGQNEGDRLLGELSDSTKDYIRRVSAFVLKLNFLQLVSAIYKAYPDMQKNSILRSA